MTAIRRAATAATLACTTALALLPAAAQAQQVFRIVGPDGKVTFSDRAPDNTAAASGNQVAGTLRSAGGVDTNALPYALRQVVSRYPVTLYSASDCSPCASARALLMQRGVPFAERTVNTNEDVEALKRLSGESGLPFATIGTQQLKGFSDVEWSQYLDAAGYPAQSQLPASYRRAPATPLVAQVAKPAAAPASVHEAAPPAARPAAPARSTTNPAGIIF
ncbi:MAG TPA: NrdH-redoxin [Comamonadaceae bacterium]|uniref:glutaredoxin family protein n=1 Tax=Pulveribacter sp. TaxID=2678893 RepID=UPI000ECAEFD3|nr:glutaredoxin family protein [Pulveribacter sp.]HCL85262.1 NrdH-redoxin [Comamonadaceae bacterium]